MTTAELRALVEATPACDVRGEIVSFTGFGNSTADVSVAPVPASTIRLYQLAPQLALLAADMADALVEIGGGYVGISPPCFCDGDSTTASEDRCDRFRAILARFAALSSLSGTGTG